GAAHGPTRSIEGRRVARVQARQREIETGRDPGRIARRAIDALTDLQTLAVEEALAGLVGDGEMGGPRRRETTAFGTEDDVLEAQLPRFAVGGRPGEVTGVVPPLG